MQTESTDTNKLTHSLTAQYWENLPERPAILGLGLLLVYFCFGMAHWGWVPILDSATLAVGSSRVDLQACKLEYSIVSPK